MNYSFFGSKVIAFVGVLLAQFAFGQENQIPWNEERKLTWDDFVSLEKGRNRFSAESSCGLSYKTEQIGSMVYVHVHAYFLPKESWVLSEKMTEALLAHEQLHFDIAELFARKMKMTFAEYELPVKTFIDKKADQRMEKAYHQIFKEMMEMQHLYDEETGHGTDVKAQEEWVSQIKNKLGVNHE